MDQSSITYNEMCRIIGHLYVQSQTQASSLQEQYEGLLKQLRTELEDKNGLIKKLQKEVATRTKSE